MTSETTAPDPRKFQRDVLWNFASIAVLGVSGILINVLVVETFDAAALGVYSQVWAWYVFFSQLAVGGVDLSVLKEVSAHSKDRKELAEIAIGALVPTIGLAALAAAVFYFGRGEIARFEASDSVAIGVAAAAPGLFFFALNKVLFGIVNGLQRMRAFALFQSARYLLMLAGFFVVAKSGMGPARVAFLFSFAEGILFLMLAFEVGFQIPWRAAGEWRPWSRTHVVYGAKSFLSGVLLELNSRVDVILLGVFLEDGPVGVYTFASMLAEGVFQLMVKLQNNYNPRIAQFVARGELRELEAMVKQGRVVSWLLMLGVGTVGVAIYPFALDLFANGDTLRASIPPFAILIGGIALCAGYMPFQQTLLMANRPGWHTLMMLAMVAVNVIGNLILIPIWGLEGSAVATAIAMASSVLLLRALVAKQLGARI
jgi:O-antigen/teichoic acid export membrane protein